MKYIFSLLTLFVFLSFKQADDIYSIGIKSIDGENISLSRYKGKKLLFITLPLSEEDTTVSIAGITRLQAKYQNTLVIIGIPSEEAGYKTENEGKLKGLYDKAAPNIIISEGMKVKKGIEQSSLFQWLTRKEMNHHFDQDTHEVGSKFFVDEEGQLYAVLGPKLPVTSLTLDRVLARISGKQ